MKYTSVIAALFVVMLMMVGTLCAQDAAPAVEKKDLAATLEAAGTYKTLLTALKAADMTSALKGKEPLTVFAPTDAAFAKIPADDLAALLANQEDLKAVLSRHVVAGKVMAAEVVKMKDCKTISGEVLRIFVKDDGVMIGVAKVIKTDLEAANGVIHAIDTVLVKEAPVTE